MKQFDGLLEERIDTQLEDIVNRMFTRCLLDRRYKQAVGVAFETRRLDILERVLSDAVSLFNPYQIYYKILYMTCMHV